MPIDPETNQCIPFTEGQISAMGIHSVGVRDGSHPTETREIGTNTFRRQFLVSWEYRYEFFELVLGNVTVYDDSGTLRLSRLLPDSTYGRHHENPQIIATKIERAVGHKITGEDEDGLPQYQEARVDVFYEHVPWSLLTDAEIATAGGDEFNRYTVLPGLDDSPSEVEAVTMPGGILHYIRESGSDIPHLQPVPFNISRITPTQRRVFKFVRLPEDAYGPGTPLHDRIFSGDGDGIPFQGCVNKNDLLFSYDTGYPKGTLLFENVRDRLYRNPVGTGWVWDLDYIFNYRPVGWNWLYYFDPSVNPDGSPANPDANGIFLVGKGNTHYFSDTLPDFYSIYNARDLNLLWSVD